MRARIIALAALSGVLTACAATDSAASHESLPRGGETRWIDVPEGRLKTRVYSTEALNARPVLIVALHGDIPDPPPSYQYYFAQALVEGFGSIEAMPESFRKSLGADPNTDDLVTAGVLRPGYTDESGERSDGEFGLAVGDNYTPEVADAVARAISDLTADYDARAVVLIGHSGGATIAANILGRHPELADAALLVACGCDPTAWRARMAETTAAPIFQAPTRSLLPLDLSASVSPGVKVRLVVGDADDVAPPQYSIAYADALRTRGVDAEVVIAPGLGHNILFSRVVFDELEKLLSGL